MKNSNERCQPLFLPFHAYELDAGKEAAVSEPVMNHFATSLLAQEAQIRLELDGEEEILQPGEAVIICPGVPYRFLPERKETLRALLLRLDPDRMPSFPDYAPSFRTILMEARRQKMPMKLSAEDMEKLELRTVLDGCTGEERERPFGYDLNISLRLGEACLAVVRFWLERGLILPGRDTREVSVYSLTGYIQNHLQDGLRVEDLAEKCGLSYPWFAKKFRDLYGASCKEYIEQIRIFRVEQFLRFTSMDLAQISEATGYADCSHMIKNFKRVMDITPGQFRQRLQRQGQAEV